MSLLVATHCKDFFHCDCHHSGSTSLLLLCQNPFALSGGFPKSEPRAKSLTLAVLCGDMDIPAKVDTLEAGRAGD